MVAAVASWSPVIMMVRMPAVRHVAMAAFAYVLVGLLLRINVRGTQLGTISLAILTVVAVILAIAAVVVGRKPSSGEGSGT